MTVRSPPARRSGQTRLRTLLTSRYHTSALLLMSRCTHGGRSGAVGRWVASRPARSRRVAVGGPVAGHSTRPSPRPAAHHRLRPPRSRDVDFRRALGLASSGRRAAVTRPVTGPDARDVGNDDEPDRPPRRARPRTPASRSDGRPVRARAAHGGGAKTSRRRPEGPRGPRARHPRQPRRGRTGQPRRPAAPGRRPVRRLTPTVLPVVTR